jgi:hypothetical protein
MKKGDIVIALEDAFLYDKGDMGKIECISKGNLLCNFSGFKNHEAFPPNSWWIYPQQVRLATNQEIQEKLECSNAE